MPDVVLTATTDEAEVQRVIKRGVRRQIGAWLRALYQEMLNLFDEPKTGAPGPVNTRSAPGEAPARQFGDLAGSLHPYMLGELTGVLDVESEIGAILNVGTLDGRIAPRPFVNPAIERFFALEETGALDVGGGVL